MDFEVIDSVHADTLGKGDLVSLDGEFHQLRSNADVDDHGLVTVMTYNLTNGDDEDSLVFEEQDMVDIYRSF